MTRSSMRPLKLFNPHFDTVKLKENDKTSASTFLGWHRPNKMGLNNVNILLGLMGFLFYFIEVGFDTKMMLPMLPAPMIFFLVWEALNECD